MLWPAELLEIIKPSRIIKSKIMKTRKIPFDVAKAKAGARVVTREDSSVRIICYDRLHHTVGCITALVRVGLLEEKVVSYHQDGSVTSADVMSEDQWQLDLFILEEVKEVSAADLSGLKVGDTVWDILKNESGVVLSVVHRICVTFGVNNCAYYSLDGRRSTSDKMQMLFRAPVKLIIPTIEV